MPGGGRRQDALRPRHDYGDAHRPQGGLHHDRLAVGTYQDAYVTGAHRSGGLPRPTATVRPDEARRRTEQLDDVGRQVLGHEPHRQSFSTSHGGRCHGRALRETKRALSGAD